MNRIMTVRAPDELQKQLTDAAEETGIGRNALILTILWDWINARRHEHLLETKENNGHERRTHTNNTAPTDGAGGAAQGGGAVEGEIAKLFDC